MWCFHKEMHASLKTSLVILFLLLLTISLLSLNHDLLSFLNFLGLPNFHIEVSELFKFSDFGFWVSSKLNKNLDGINKGLD